MKIEKTEFGEKIILPPAPHHPFILHLSSQLFAPTFNPWPFLSPFIFFEKIPLFPALFLPFFPILLFSVLVTPRYTSLHSFPLRCTLSASQKDAQERRPGPSNTHTHTHGISEWNENRKPCGAQAHKLLQAHTHTHTHTLTQRQGCLYTLPEPVTVSPWRLCGRMDWSCSAAPTAGGVAGANLSAEDWLNTSCSPFLSESQTIQKYRPKPLFPFFFFLKGSLRGCGAAFHNFSITWRSRSVAENFTPSWFVNVLLRGVKGLVLHCRCSWRDNASNLGLNKYTLLYERDLIPYIYNLNLSFT